MLEDLMMCKIEVDLKKNIKISDMHAAFSTIVAGKCCSKQTFKELKMKAQSWRMMAMKNELVDCTAQCDDPLDTEMALKDLFQVGDTSQVLLLSNELHTRGCSKEV